MTDAAAIFDGLILAGGPPRSGTTILAKVLNSHPGIALATDNNVYESWGLYYYRSRVGLVQQLRDGEISAKEFRRRLAEYLVKDDQVWGIASTDEVGSYPLVPGPLRPDAGSTFAGMARQQAKRLAQRTPWGRSLRTRRGGLQRHRVPVDVFRDVTLCLKSPEISFVIPELAAALPESRFVLVHRPVIETAESMYRKGFEWRLPSYHRRWARELNEDGSLRAPPGVPVEWCQLWDIVTDFQRCVIYALSYLRALVLGVQRIPSARAFVYSHVELRKEPSAVLFRLSEFLAVDPSGFRQVAATIRGGSSEVTASLVAEYDEISEQIGVDQWMEQAGGLCAVT